MDILDFYSHDRKEEYLTGYYMKDETSEPIYFEYGIVNDGHKEYGNVIDRLNADSSNLTIKSTWDVGYEINGYIKTQDGDVWQISAINQILTERNKNVMRLLRSNPSKAFEISLIGVATPERVIPM